MVHDRKNKIIYLSVSERADKEMVLKHAKLLGYKAIVFQALQSSGKAFYHTNVVMAVGENFAVVCKEGIVQKDRAKVMNSLKKH